MTALIETRNLILKYGTFVALDDISFDLQHGEFFALLGPSGCGKSSLLRILAGFNTPTSGRMDMEGRDLIRIPARRRPINMMFQSYALFPHMSVEQNIRYGLEVARLDSATIKQRTANILDITHMAPMANRLPSQLSGGQRQRVALARALVMQPKVLLLDEPLGALDKKLREAMQIELKRLQKELGITFVVVTHDQEEALAMADRIALMRNGKFEQLGTPTELYERPQTRFVADFVGRINVLSGKSNGKRVTITGVGELVSDTEASGDVSYCLRPERIRLSKDRPEGFDNRAEGRIEDISYRGEGESVMIQLAGQPELVWASLSAAEIEANRLSIGETVWLGWNASDSRVLTR